ncbi:uncharacterized protein [Ranitomeya imitator]|uniref:uncharacterized protein n=1 Tax=Ranitomeya imitator TaxID=111125 RepID=UPI0037E82B29
MESGGEQQQLSDEVAEESVKSAGLREMIRMEVRESLRSLSQAESSKHKSSLDFNSSEEEREESTYLSSPLSSSSDEESGRFCLPLDKVDKVVKSGIEIFLGEQMLTKPDNSFHCLWLLLRLYDYYNRREKLMSRSVTWYMCAANIVVDEEPLDIENETLITLVEANPSIWDQSDSSHHDIIKNRKLWDKIICQLDPRYLEKSASSKKKIADAVHTRWRSIRDRFVRDFRNSQNTPSGSSGKRVTPYVHYEQLLFLQKTLSQRSTICSTAAPRVAEEPKPSELETSQQTGAEDVSGLSEPRSMERSTVAPVVSARLQAHRGRKRSSRKDEVDAIIVDGPQRVEDLCRSEHRDLRLEITDLQSHESVYAANEWKLLFLSYVPVLQNIPPHRNMMFRQRLHDLVDEFLAPQEPTSSRPRTMDMPVYKQQYRGRGEPSIEQQRQCSSPSYSWADNTPTQYHSL